MMSLWFGLSLLGLCLSFKTTLKGREPVLYVRASTKEQKGTLKTQEETLLKWLKAQGITRKPKVFSEQISGTTMARDQDDISYMLK